MQVVQNRVPAHFHQICFRKVFQTVVVTAALMSLTRFTIELAQKRTKKIITPFKENQRATLSYSAASIAYLAASMAAIVPFTKQSGQDLRIGPSRLVNKEDQKMVIVPARGVFDAIENTLFKEGAGTFEELKARLIDSFYQTKGCRLNRLPLRLKHREKYREKMREICEFIHQGFFEGRIDVNQDRIDIYGGLSEEKKTTEWQMFIMLLYYYQREGLKTDYPIKYINTGCKDDFDRGGGQNMTTDLMHLFEIYGKEISPKKLEAIMGSVQAPTLQLKGTEPIRYRIHPALCIAELLLSLAKENTLAIQKIKRVKEVIVDKREEQPAVFLPELAQTLGEYKAILTSLRGRLYTVYSDKMIKNNCTMSMEKIISQLKRNYANGLTMNGHSYDGTVGRDGYPYTIDQIYKELTETHRLSEDTAKRIMNQLEVQIYSQPFLELQKSFEVGDLMLRGIRGMQAPISLTIEGGEFVVNGQTQFEIVDMSKKWCASCELRCKCHAPHP